MPRRSAASGVPNHSVSATMRAAYLSWWRLTTSRCLCRQTSATLSEVTRADERAPDCPTDRPRRRLGPALSGDAGRERHRRGGADVREREDDRRPRSGLRTVREVLDGALDDRGGPTRHRLGGAAADQRGHAGTGHLERVDGALAGHGCNIGERVKDGA